MIKKTLSLLFVFISFLSRAQEMAASEPEMADKFRQEGKIYVVIAVIAMVFIALVFFLVYIERRLKKLEDKMKEGS